MMHDEYFMCGFSDVMLFFPDNILRFTIPECSVHRHYCHSSPHTLNMTNWFFFTTSPIHNVLKKHQNSNISVPVWNCTVLWLVIFSHTLEIRNDFNKLWMFDCHPLTLTLTHILWLESGKPIKTLLCSLSDLQLNFCGTLKLCVRAYAHMHYAFYSQQFAMFCKIYWLNGIFQWFSSFFLSFRFISLKCFHCDDLHCN